MFLRLDDWVGFLGEVLARVRALVDLPALFRFEWHSVETLSDDNLIWIGEKLCTRLFLPGRGSDSNVRVRLLEPCEGCWDGGWL